MPASPSERLDRLSLTSPKHGMASRNANPDHHHSEDDDDDESGSEWDESPIEQSPTGFKYNISLLSENDQQMVRDLFRQTGRKRQPSMLFDYCRIFHVPSAGLTNAQEGEEDGDEYYYAFRLQEVKPFTIRIKANNSTSSMISCPCKTSESGSEETGPCSHVLWLLDHIAKHTLSNQTLGTELHLTEDGRIAELGSAFKRISDMRLSILADGLHCDIESDLEVRLPPTPRRIQEAKNMTATLAGFNAHRYERNLEDEFDRSTIVYQGDLERTIFSLILSSPYIFELVRAELDNTDPPNNPFYELEGQALQVIRELDLYAASLQAKVVAAELGQSGKQWEPPRDVPWAAGQIEMVTGKINTLVREDLLAGGYTGHTRSKMADFAARALVQILNAVVHHNHDSHQGITARDRNLYQRLIGSRNSNFICDGLALIVNEQRAWADQISILLELCASHGCPEPWLTKMRNIAQHMKSGHRSDVPKKPRHSPDAGAYSGSSTASRQGFGQPYVLPTPTTTSQGSSPTTSTAGPHTARDRFVRPEHSASVSALSRAGHHGGPGSQNTGSKRKRPR